MEKKILIAEDDPVSRQILKKVLKKEGYEIIEAENGQAALSSFMDDKINILITDWFMPEIEGLELTRRIRSLKLDYYVYIIMITGNEDRKSVLKGFDAGADDYIVKPYMPEEVIARIRTGYRVIGLEERYYNINQTLRKKNRDLEELRSHLSWAALEASNSYVELKQMFNLSSDGICVIDRDFNVVKINDRLLKLTDCNDEAVIGKKCFDIFSNNMCKSPACPLTRILNDEDLIEFEMEREVKKEELSPLSFQLMHLKEWIILSLE